MYLPEFLKMIEAVSIVTSNSRVLVEARNAAGDMDIITAENLRLTVISNGDLTLQIDPSSQPPPE